MSPPNPRADDERPTAYSYVRMSTKRQELGDSLRRQVAMAEKYAAEHSLRLSPKSFRDMGVSGFKQRNIRQGALAAFIAAVKSGLIASPCTLLIEHFDRLSRAEVNIAYRLLLDLVELDVTVVTLVDERIWDIETIQDIGNIITSIILMSRAHEESAMKAVRLRETWSEKKGAATQVVDGKRAIVTSECPRWLRANADKTGFDVIEDLAESVRKLYDVRIREGLGAVALVSRANSEGWPVPGKRPVQGMDEDTETFERRSAAGATWHTSLVGRLLTNRAVLGEYLPHVTVHVKVKGQADKKVRRPLESGPIPGYYPAIIDEQTFLRAQAVGERHGRFPGRRDASLKNWLQGMLKCVCGHSFVRKNKNSSAQPGYARYYCTARNRGVSDCASASAKQLEDAVLFVVSNVAPQHFQGTARLEELKARVDVLEVEISAARQTRDRFIEAIGSSRAPIPSLLQRLTEAEDALAQREKERRTVRAELADYAGDSDAVLENILKAVRGVASLEARAELREELSRIIERVVVHQSEGYIRVFLRGSDVPIQQFHDPSKLVPQGMPNS